MMKRNCCIYNGEYHRIEEVYTVCDDKQINIPEVLEKFREWADQRKLLCACGCGTKLTIVAGSKMHYRQHFRELPGQKTMIECRSTAESDITYYSNVILKCWLDDIWKLRTGDVKFHVPICKVSKEQKKYEYTHYVEKYHFGLCYQRLEGNIDNNKVKLMFDNSKNSLLYLVDISNSKRSVQYQEYLMKIQHYQGFCMFLDTKNKANYLDALVKITFYKKDFLGLWKELKIFDGKLKDFSIDIGGRLLYKGKDVAHKTGECITAFELNQCKLKEEHQEKINQIKKEAERSRREEQLRREAVERRLLLRQKEIENNEEKQETKLFKFYSNDPNEALLNRDKKITILKDFLSKQEKIEGDFYSRGKDSILSSKEEMINIHNVSFNLVKQRIEFFSTTMKKFNIYMVKDENDAILENNEPYPFSYFPVYWIKENDITDCFKEMYKCIKNM